jgi:hypothetical protein
VQRAGQKDVELRAFVVEFPPIRQAELPASAHDLAERDVRARVHREAPTLGDLDQLNERARRLEQVLDPYALERFPSYSSNGRQPGSSRTSVTTPPERSSNTVVLIDSSW